MLKGKLSDSFMAPNDEDPDIVTELECYYMQQQKQITYGILRLILANHLLTIPTD